MNTETNYYGSMLELIKREDPYVAECINNELHAQRDHLKLIASENYCSPAVQAAAGNWMTDKYSEGIPYKRYYSGCENVDKIEAYADKLACELFGADHANVQPHCGSDANLMAYWAVLKAKIMDPFMTEQRAKGYSNMVDVEWQRMRELTHGQTLLALDYTCGGHLTHGFRQNISAQLFNVKTYGVNKDGWVDYDDVREKALRYKPLIILAGFSAYPRNLNFKKFRDIADEVGAVLMVDMAHFAGLVAGKQLTGIFNPIPYADIVTTTTHKTLRGPRGGMVLCKEWLAPYVDEGCPTMMGGPLPHIMAAKAIALKEALDPSFEQYAAHIIRNAEVLAQCLKDNGFKVQTDGTENHIVLVDVTPFGLNGRQAEQALLEAGIVVNRNALPSDKNGAWYTSGLRLGTPALTTRGFDETDMYYVAEAITTVLKGTKPHPTSRAKYTIDPKALEEAKAIVNKLLEKHPLYPEVEI